MQTPGLFNRHNSSPAKVIKIILDGDGIQIQAVMNNSRINTSASFGTYPKYIPIELFF
jgi:hypothetical protein